MEGENGELAGIRARIAEERFWKSASDGDVEASKEILKHNPTLDVNWPERIYDQAVLHPVCENGNASIVSILLAHPAIDVNQKDTMKNTPFTWVCAYGRTSCGRLLLRDSRVKVNEPDEDGSTPLRYAASHGHLDVIKWWIASGREMDLGKPGDDKTDAIWREEERKDRSGDPAGEVQERCQQDQE